MSTEPLPPSQPDFVDQRAGLIVFGILEILIGCFCALMVPLMFLGMAMQQGIGSDTAMNRSMIFPAVMFYGVIAAAFIWLGIGSVLCRRWARALLLILSWVWLVTGVLGMGFYVVMFPKMLGKMPSEAGSAVFGILSIIFTCMFLVIPGVMTFFYMRRNVKATCEVRDPVQRWTDACPLPVLAASLGMGSGVPMMLAMVFAHKCFMPFCGFIINGTPAILAYIGLAVFSGWVAWGLYRFQPMAWRATLVFAVAIGVSSIVNFAHIDMMEMYRQMGYPQQQIEQLQDLNMLQGKGMIIWMTCCMVFWFGYLLWIKKFFRRSA